MAENKKSFLLYCDVIHTVKKLSDEQAGLLFKHTLKYVNDENPDAPNTIIDLVFEQIKQGLKRDLKKYEAICERNKINGLLGGRPKNPDEPKEPSGLIGNPENPDEPRKADSDSDSDSDSEKKRKEFHLPEFEKFWNLYGKKTGRSKSEKKFISLTNKEREKIFETLPAYVKRVTDPYWRKDPCTYLNGKNWDDVIIPTEAEKIKERYDPETGKLNQNRATQ